MSRLSQFHVLLAESPSPKRISLPTRYNTHGRHNHLIQAKAICVIDGIALVHCYILCNRTQQICLLNLARGVDRERVEADVFQLDCTTKLPVRTTHGDDVRLDLFNGFAFEVLHDGKRFLSESFMGRSNDGRLRFILVLCVPNGVGDHSLVIRYMPADRTRLQPVLWTQQPF